MENCPEYLQLFKNRTDFRICSLYILPIPGKNTLKLGDKTRKTRNLPENVFIMKKVSSVFISYKMRLFFQSPDNRITL